MGPNRYSCPLETVGMNGKEPPATSLSSFYIFLAIIGGGKYFGLSGLLYGPLILGLASVMLYVYCMEDRGLLDEKGKV